MSFRKVAGGGKRDIAEGPICEALDAVGALYWRLGGKGNPDLLVLFRGSYYVGEVKTGKGRETKNQGKFPIWRTPDDAFHTIGAARGV